MPSNYDFAAAAAAARARAQRETAILRLWESYDLVADVPAQQLILFAIDRLSRQ